MASQEDKPVVVYTTFASLGEGEKIAKVLVNEKLAACVNMFDGMISVYRWQGASECSREVAAIIKTRTSMARPVMERIHQLHSYETPALLVLPVVDGGAGYLDWIMEQTATGG